MVLTFESVDDILKHNHSNEIFRAVLFRVYHVMPYKLVLAFETVAEVFKG